MSKLGTMPEFERLTNKLRLTGISSVWCLTRTQTAAAQALGQLGDKRAVPALLQVLLETNSGWGDSTKLVHAAAKALDGLADADAVPELIGILDHGRTRASREKSALLLGRLHDARAVPALADALTNPSSDLATKNNVLWALDEIGNQSVVDVLFRVLGDEELSYDRVAQVLDKLTDDSHIDRLVEAVASTDRRVRCYAISRLEDLADRSTVGPLLPVLDRLNISDFEQSTRFLNRLIDKSHVEALDLALCRGNERVHNFARRHLRKLGLQPACLTLTCRPTTAAPATGVYSELGFSIINTGQGPNCRSTLLKLSGNLVGPDPISLTLDDVINPGEAVTRSVEILPQAAGPVPLHWELKYHHHLERDWLTGRGLEHIDVSGNDHFPPSVSIGTWIQRPVHQSRVTVGGDLLQAGAIKQGEGVVLQKTGLCTVLDRSGFSQVQGEDSDSPKASAYCPNCGAGLLEN